MSNASRQKRYRDKQRRAQEAIAQRSGVTVPVPDGGIEPESNAFVTKSPENVTESAPNVTENSVSSEIPRKNRIPPIPGDDGYKGVCKQVDGVWVVKPDPPLPPADLTDAELQIRLKSYEGASWVDSPEHKEVLERRAAQEPVSRGAWA